MKCRICRTAKAGESGTCMTCSMKAANKARMLSGETKACPYCKGTKAVTWGPHGACDYCPSQED